MPMRGLVWEVVVIKRRMGREAEEKGWMFKRYEAREGCTAIRRGGERSRVGGWLVKA